jgi:ribosomal protein L40E
VNFDLWREHKSYKAYYEDKGKTSVSFTFSIASKGDIPNSLCFLVEEVHTRPTVLVNATISWTEKSPKTRCSEYVSSSPTLFIEEAKDFKLRGNATEANGNRFNFYIMDSSNYWNWITDKAYVAIFEQKNINPVNFDVPLTKDQAGSTLYFVVENPLKDVNESVIVNAVLEWQEKPTVSATLGGWVLGSFIAVIGFIIIIIAGIASLVFKPKRPKGKTYTGVIQQRPPPPAYSRPSKPRPKVVQKDYVATDKIYCVYCGAENRADARFCRKCGKPMD